VAAAPHQCRGNTAHLLERGIIEHPQSDKIRTRDGVSQLGDRHGCPSRT
jgi:hypothetical protein